MATTNLTLEGFLTRFLLQAPPTQMQPLPTRRAAVLVPVVERAQPGLLLTRRTTHLRKHAGQVAFPGGMMDPDDVSLTATALREAMEEVAIPPDSVRVIGTLPPVTSSTGFQVTPVVGIIPPDIARRASEDEVDAIFEMPLQEALRLARYHPLDIHRHGLPHRVWLSWYQHYFVWGMTAGIIRQLSLQIAEDVA
ncbi:CoA pyrophosphatase [Paramixta manurensis]|uniref:CoA pyrophosphatase n=1 Tax=Paramixta manurensis TaxID=2740817 RepID=A0A6M8UEI9_9GAMM|nr:CoA pyrophosphatase [Erwiniaceae bacterium PD-1]